ncbi:bis(5'-nucleosyl)-tetraphosphatase PrpE [asymmetrical]-like [Mercenaria mercenaria]|uniref:bis(5'-nucleosyl)-tetraphosphatase PrpE [asymmetrical]-like n=1 Tax=Mercenaria mercenaria TaxID=6596 RepID=UPI001E1E1DB8|nr:bis(5'-nucleosyl)-tetraphosphatase PrpE [asymmetrical]-like [Mercenaria mercenaria]
MASLISNLLSLLIRAMPVRAMSSVRTNKHDLPLPSICHEDLPTSAVGGRAVFVIGDVHGCLDEMNGLIDKAKNIENDTMFVFVGDLVNKGPYSVGVLRRIREMRLNGNAFAVRGNHDESALRKFINYKTDPDYEIPEGYDWIKELMEQDFNFLSALPYTISIPSLNAIIVHGGIVPGKPLEMQKLNDLTNMRNIIDTGDAFENEGLIGYNKPDKGVPWVDMWPGPEHVYFGHDARRKLQLAQYATGLDTGCCYGEELTGVFINRGRQILSVKSRQKFSFDEE